MYKLFSNPLPLKFGRMYVSNDAMLNTGPAQKGDVVTIRVSDDTDFYILVENSSSAIIQGEVVGIGPDPQFEYEDWTHGSKIEVTESAIAAIIRAN